ncbi:hypothetical protein AB1Y20_019919 [Prymnesium parvum]|uniref:G-patch domain-containing protein n=1 Tax=Prymnesium parvum TaxID=97485 RepID=A0AB34JWF6_PRYPA
MPEIKEEIKEEEGARDPAVEPPAEETTADPPAPPGDDGPREKLKKEDGRKSHRRRSRDRSASRERTRERRGRSRDRSRDRSRSRERGRRREHSRDRREHRERERDYRGSPSRRRRSRSYSPRGRERRRSRSASYERRRPRGGGEPAYDKEAVKAALERVASGVSGVVWPGMGMLGGAAVGTFPAAGVAHAPISATATGAPPLAKEMLPAPSTTEDGKAKARDFSFLVTEDKQDSGPNLSMLDAPDSDSDSDSEENNGDGEEEEEEGFEAGSAIDQLLWRQKAVSGMETRRPGESVTQFLARRTAGLRMLKAQAGSHDAKQLENEVDVAIMNSSTQWHWGAGDPNADISDEEPDAPLALGGPSETLAIEYKPAEGEPPLPGDPPPPPPPPDGAMVPYGSRGGGGAMVTYDPERITQRRVIIGSEAVRASAALVPRPTKDALSNSKLAPIESGRGLALLEKMGWKKGQGLGREGSGTTAPVEASIKTDMGGLRSEEEQYGVAPALMSADGPELTNGNFSINASSMLSAAKSSMDSEFSSITTQTKSVQQINEENRRAAAGLPPLPGSQSAASSATPPPAAPPAPQPTPPRPSAPPAAPQPMMYNGMPPHPGMPYMGSGYYGAPGHLPPPYMPQMYPGYNMYGMPTMPPAPWGWR